MNNYYHVDEPYALSIKELRKMWDDLPKDEQDGYRDDYAWAVIDGACDAGNLPFHRIFCQTQKLG